MPQIYESMGDTIVQLRGQGCFGLIESERSPKEAAGVLRVMANSQLDGKD
jgi:hypothetical protein